MKRETASRTALSLILPTYQEKENILEILPRLEKILAGEDYEIIIVDDDSPDETWREAERYAMARPRVRVIRRITDRGLSGAILEGFEAAKGGILGVMDADLSHDENVVPLLLRAVRDGADVAVASRRIPGGGAERWPWYRRFTSDVATFLAKAALTKKLSDPMSGFFFLKRDVYERVKDRLRPRGYKILLEIVARARPLEIREVPFVFRDRRNGYSKLSGFVILSYLESLFELRFGVSPLDRMREAYHRGRYFRVLSALRAGTLLDVGCGRPCDSMPDGAFLRQAGRGVGVDVKPCRIPFEFRQAPVEELPFGNGAFDNVVAMEVMEHVDDLPRALGEVDRVLKSGGLFVMTVPDDNLIWHALWWIWTRLVGRMWRDTHKVSLDRKGWLGILKERFDIVNLGRHWYFDLIFVCRKKAT